MNISNFYHALLIIGYQIIFILFSLFIPNVSIELACVLGSLFEIGFYFGREVAQHERKVGTPPWYSGFKIWEWSLDAKLDLLFPLIVGILMPVILYFTL